MLRRGLLVIGVLIALVGSVSFFRALQISFDGPGLGGKAVLHHGTLDVLWISKLPGGNDPSSRVNRVVLQRTELERYRSGASTSPWPALDRSYLPYYTFFRLPLWLLAAVCLAWPVTSFILARRRRKGRGFEVRAEVRDQKSEVSPASENTEGALK